MSDGSNKIKKKIFYVNSYGGSGSYLLCEYLAKYGIAYHLHERKVYDRLRKASGKNTVKIGQHLAHLDGKDISEDELINYYYIFIYKNPVNAVKSRFSGKQHLINIKCDPNIKLVDVLEQKKDLYGIEEFFDNHVNENSNRNYKIYCVKYSDLFDKIEELNKVFGLDNIEGNYPVKKERKHKKTNDEELNEIYKSLNEKIDKMPFIKIV